MRIQFIACLLGLIGHAAAAEPSVPLTNASSCLPEIIAAERHLALPPKLLQTIGIVETGRTDPATGRVVPWPWSINVAGVDRVFETKAAAIAAVQDLQNDGIRSIDVGCMQVNLMYHPSAFASLDEAFDPSANVQYAARFLRALYQEIGAWPQAAAAYHSRTQEIGASYETRVMAMWPLADQFPDPTLLARGQAGASMPDTSRYTPALAAELKQMWTDRARLAALKSRADAVPARQPPMKPAATDYSRYTPAFAAELKQLHAGDARVAMTSESSAARTRPQPTNLGRADDGRSRSEFAAIVRGTEGVRDSGR